MASSTTNSADNSPSSSPINSNNAPKFGTLVPNRIFVGGITPNTSESELFDLFSVFGNVKAAKIIADRAGVSKGYGFVTFETEEEAQRIQKEDNVVLKDRKLNIAPAIRKQPFGRMYGSLESSSDRPGTPRQPRNSVDWSVGPPVAADPAPLVPSNSTVYYHSGASYYTPNGAIYAPSEGGYQYSQPQYYPTMVYSPVYIQPSYPAYQSPTSAQTQWSGQTLRWASHVGYGQSSSPHTSASSSATTMPQYVYSTNGCPATPSTNSGQTTSSVTTTMAAVQTQSGGEPCAINTPIAATIAYPYPPPTILAPYQPNIGSGDVADVPLVEASTSTEQSPQTQDSMGPMMAVSHTGVSTAVHFVRAFPTPVHGSDDYRLPQFEQGLPPAYRGYRKGYQSGSPHKMHFSYNAPAQQYRPKGRAGHSSYNNHCYNSLPSNVTTPTNNGNANVASGSAFKKPNGNPTSPLTPPPTPMASATHAKENGSVVETAHRFKALNL